MALRLGVTQQTLSALERRADTMGTGRLLQLLSVLGAELVLRVPDAPDRPVPAAEPLRPGETDPW